MGLDVHEQSCHAAVLDEQEVCSEARLGELFKEDRGFVYLTAYREVL
jgi:hypothetical protein